MFTPRFVLFPIALIGGLLAACQSSPDATDSPDAGERTGASTGSSGENDPSGSAGGGDAGGTGGFGGTDTRDDAGTAGEPGGDAGAGGSAGSDPGTCMDGSIRVDAHQLDIYVMFDVSGSMIPHWAATLDAVFAFLNDPQSAGIGVGIQFFGSECDPDFYANPAVPIAPLPGNAQTIEEAFPFPTAGTATDPAMEGAVMYASSWKEQHPDHEVIIMLVTDGIPTNCESSVAGSAAHAANGLSQHGIPTYVVGIGGEELALDAIAEAGGTGSALMVSPNASEQLVQAMNEIRGQAQACEYALPTEAESLDHVNLQVVPEMGSATTIERVRGPDECHAVEGGWYYATLIEPSHLVVCPAICELLTSRSAEAHVVLGCPTVLAN